MSFARSAFATTLLTVSTVLTASTVLTGQCPDGAPPPCRSATRPATPAANSVAVLYFENRSRDSNDLYLADGITEEIITRLSRIERVTVRSRQLVRRFRGATADPAEVGRALNVTYIVSGSLRRSGDRLRVSAELTRAVGGAQVWGQQFDQEGGDVFAIQEAVAREVATGIVGRLLPAEQQVLAARPTTSQVAYDAYLRGNFYAARRDSAGLTRALREYQAALRADPEFTDALARTAFVYGLAIGNDRNLGLPRDTVIALAMRAATEVVRRAPNSADSWIGMALARYAAEPRTLTGMREAAERAVSLDPNSAEAHHQLSFALSMLGDDSGAATHARMALAIDPTRPITLANLGQREMLQGRYAEARRWADSALAVDPDFQSGRLMRVVLLTQTGELAAARAEMARWHALPGLGSLAAAWEPLLDMPRGDTAAARSYRDRFVAPVAALAPTPSGLWALLLCFTTADREAMLMVLERATRAAQLHSFLRSVAFDSLRADARFQRLVGRRPLERRSSRSRRSRGFGAAPDAATTLLTILTILTISTALTAQCPDGAPPSCRTTSRPAAPSANSVAVLYFENATRDTSDAYLSDGITEEIISRLSGIERVTVRSRYLVRRYRGTVLEDPAALGRALNVTYLVSGSVRRAGGRLRVNAELIRAAGGAQVWGQQFDQSGDDVFAIQDAVARAVATGIVGRLLPNEQQSLAVRPTTSAEAYQAVLRGNFNLARRDSAGILRAIVEYESALRADPAYVDALSRVGLAYGIAHSNGYGIGLPKDTVAARALRYATDAVRRAPNSSDAWTAMGIANLVNHPRTLEGSREGFERAIALDPGNAEPHHLLGFTAALAGEDSVGLAHDRMALALEPARPVTIMHLAHFALKHRRTAEALRWVDSALVVNPAFVNGHMLRVTLLLVAGDTSEARAEVARWRSLPSPAFYIPLYERALAPRGQDSAQVRAWREQIRAAIPAELPVNLGGYSALMVMVADGDAATVMPLFEASQPRGAYIHYFMSFPVFDPIRGDARFQRLFQETAP